MNKSISVTSVMKWRRGRKHQKKRKKNAILDGIFLPKLRFVTYKMEVKKGKKVAFEMVNGLFGMSERE